MEPPFFFFPPFLITGGGSLLGFFMVGFFYEPRGVYLPGKNLWKILFSPTFLDVPSTRSKGEASSQREASRRLKTFSKEKDSKNEPVSENPPLFRRDRDLLREGSFAHVPFFFKEFSTFCVPGLPLQGFVDRIGGKLLFFRNGGMPFFFILPPTNVRVSRPLGQEAYSQ